MTRAEVDTLLQNLRNAAVLAPGRERVQVISADPDDDLVVSAALETQAHYIITGDRHLLDLGHYHGIEIITPRAFVHLLQKSAT